MSIFRKNPRGKSSVSLVVFVVVAIVAAPLLGAIAPAIPALLGVGVAEVAYAGVATGIACVTGIICQGNGNGGNNGGGGAVQQSCSSAPNACGQTNFGFLSGGVCTANPPPNGNCPAPSIPAQTGFYAHPSTISSGNSSTITWNAANATACTVTGDNGFNQSGGPSGSVSTGALSQTSTFTLTCTDGSDGPSASATLRIIIDPHYKEI